MTDKTASASGQIVPLHRPLTLEEQEKLLVMGYRLSPSGWLPPKNDLLADFSPKSMEDAVARRAMMVGAPVPHSTDPDSVLYSLLNHVMSIATFQARYEDGQNKEIPAERPGEYLLPGPRYLGKALALLRTAMGFLESDTKRHHHNEELGHHKQRHRHEGFNELLTRDQLFLQMQGFLKKEPEVTNAHDRMAHLLSEPQHAALEKVRSTAWGALSSTVQHDYIKAVEIMFGTDSQPYRDLLTYILKAPAHRGNFPTPLPEITV